MMLLCFFLCVAMSLQGFDNNKFMHLNKTVVILLFVNKEQTRTKRDQPEHSQNNISWSVLRALTELVATCHIKTPLKEKP